MNKSHPLKGILIAFLCLISINLKAQDSTKFYIFSGVGMINGQGEFGKSIKPSLGFNSGVELKLKHHLFCQFSIDFNSLKYNQQKTDNNSPYLFQNTSSNVLMLGANFGYNFNKTTDKWLASVYLGSGFLNIGEPRITLKNANTIVQSTVSQSNIFGRTGARFGYKTSSTFFQTLYLDFGYWTSPATVQNGKVQGISLLIGTRITM
jgi:Outer membrane protein beta-barrel domain